MPITLIHSYLVHPGKKRASGAKINGTSVPLSGRLFDLLDDIYANTDAQCDIEIAFNPRPDGTQQNPCRDIITDHIGAPSLAKGRIIAERLESVTTRRSGIGLVFIIVGKESSAHKFVISRFPTDSAILAEEDHQKLDVKFLERVFMKSATSYKAAVFVDTSLKAGFWTGRAVDRQINDRVIQVSNYWIADFLDADFLLTGPAGTRKLALAMRNAARLSKDLTVKAEIAAAVALSKALSGKKGTILDFESLMNLSAATKLAINENIPDGLNDQFKFDLQEFSIQLAYRSVELDNGGMLTAVASEFDDVFQQSQSGSGRTRFSTEGKIVGERLGKSKSERLSGRQ